MVTKSNITQLQETIPHYLRKNKGKEGRSKSPSLVIQKEMHLQGRLQNAHMTSLELHQIGSFTTKISRPHPCMQSCTAADANSWDLPNLCQTAEKGKRDGAREKGQDERAR